MQDHIDIIKFSDMLIEIGLEKSVDCEFDRDSVMEMIHSQKFNILVSKLDKLKLSLLIKGLCKFEEYPDMQFGSTSQIKNLIQLMGDSIERSDLINWLFVNRKNTYIPYGFDIPLSIKSEAEYIDYEQKRSEHRKNMLDLDQKNHTEAVAKKQQLRDQHSKISNEAHVIFNEFKERFQKMNDEQLMATYNEDIKKQGWVSARGRFHAALQEEFVKRGINIKNISKK